MMNLEAIEQECLRYLKSAANPLTPVDRLMRHLRDAGVLGTSSERDLIDFLENHELFRVMLPAGFTDDSSMAALIDAAGLNAKPYVILDTRVPARADLAAGLEEQLLTMADALITAVKEAREAENMDKAAQIERVLERVTAARKKLREFA